MKDLNKTHIEKCELEMQETFHSSERKSYSKPEFRELGSMVEKTKALGGSGSDFLGQSLIPL